MSILQNFITPKRFNPLCVRNTSHNLIPFSNPIFLSLRKHSSVTCLAISKSSEPEADPEPSSIPNLEIGRDEDPDASFPTTIPRKKRRGRRSEAVEVEDFVRESLERTFASIKQQNSGIMENKDNLLKDRIQDDVDSESSDDDNDDDENEDADIGRSKKKKMVVEEEDPDWPLDADVGWGVRASEYFEEHPIKNVIGEDGFEIDWEGEVDDNWVKEINCLEWESFAFHPSPLVVLVFERYNRATSNWKTLKELEKAIKVYWSAKDRLPPRAVKLDINIERDLAYALKVKECPQILFLLGNRILYRDKEFRTSDELVQMIAHFYYKAKKPSWVNYAAVSPP